MSGPPPGRPGGLSLYADLLEPPPSDASASISRAPVVSQEALDAVKDRESAAAKKPTDPALRFQPFQPIRRPQPPKPQQKPKANFPKAAPSAANTNANAPAGSTTTGAPPPAKSTLADWVPNEDDEFAYANNNSDKRARGGRKKKKKKQWEAAPVETNWDEIYDPSRPTNVDEYLRSDERVREVREWKALLYRHKRPSAAKRRPSWDNSDSDDDRPVTNQFAPPGSYGFAPPPPPPPSPPSAHVPDDKTGGDAYARRIAMSQGFAPPPEPQGPPPPPPPAQAEPAFPAAPPPPPPDADSSATIARAPVRYAPPEPTTTATATAEAPPPDPGADPDTMDVDGPDTEATAPTRTKMPGQKGFAARLMSKYGWSKGQGLGANETGIAKPLLVQVEKRRKDEDGRWAEPGGRGKIIAPKGASPKNNTPSSSSDSPFGPLSRVIVMRRMLQGLEDLQHEMEEGLGQEIGEECGDRYGRVERVYIDVAGGSGSGAVYIKFVDAVSALRAVGALDGRVFAGNAIEPRFYDEDAFERGIYE